MQRNLLGGSVEYAAVKIQSVPEEPGEIDALLTNGYELKSISQHYKSQMEDIVREYNLMAQLKGNANIVHCEDLAYEPDADGVGWKIYIKMELLTPLPAALGNPIREDQVIKLGMDLCNALVACKSKNIIHRDIKPGNIMVAEDGNYKLGDFGEGKTSMHTAGGTKRGTYGFMAPEVYNNQPYNLTVDLYSLGLVMYWMLNRRCEPFLPLPPELPRASDLENAHQRRFGGEALPPPADGSPELKRIVLKACEASPARRYAGPEELYADLQAVAYRQKSASYSGTARDYGSAMGGTVNGTMGGTMSSTLGGAGTAQSFGGEEKTLGNSWGSEAEETQCVGRSQSFAQDATMGNPRKKAAKGSFDLSTTLELTAQELSAGCAKKVKAGRRTLEIQVPAGSGAGQKLRIQGYGKQDSSTGARGDLYVELVQSGDVWSRQGGGNGTTDLDIHVDLDLSPEEMTGGCAKTIPDGYDDQMVEITVPPASKRKGNTFCVPGRGLMLTNGKRGDMIVTVHQRKEPVKVKLDLSMEERKNGCTKKVDVDKQTGTLRLPPKLKENQKIVQLVEVDVEGDHNRKFVLCEINTGYSDTPFRNFAAGAMILSGLAGFFFPPAWIVTAIAAVLLMIF